MRIFLVCCFLIAVLNELHAHSVAPSSKNEILADSDLVVVGRVQGRESYRQDYLALNHDGIEHISKGETLTDWKIEILETIKGSCIQPEMKVTWLGGTIDKIKLSTSLDFYLDKGDIALFFLTWDERNKKWMPYGGSSRVFLVEDYGSEDKLQPTNANDMTVVLSRRESGVKRTGPLLHAETLEDFDGRKVGCM